MSTTNEPRYDFDFADLFLYILAFIIPPVPVLIRYGVFTNQFLLNLLLTLLFGLPGTIHSIYLIYRSSKYYTPSNIEPDYERIIDSEAGPSSNNTDNTGSNSSYPPNDVKISEAASSSSAPKLPTYEESESSFQNPTDNKVQR